MLGLGLTRFLPASVRPNVIMAAGFVMRQKAWQRFDRARRRIPARHNKRPYVGENVAVAGFFSMRSGLARGAQLMVLDLRAKGKNVSAIDLTRALRMPIEFDAPGVVEPEQLRDLRVTDLVVHVNPPQFQNALSAFPLAALRNVPCIVGMWAWELEKAPDTWQESSVYCDELWGPSTFVADALRRTIPSFSGTVRAVPHPVDAEPFPLTTAEQRAEARARLGLTDAAFVAGYSFSMSSNFARKNPLGAIRAFQDAFPNDREVRLIIRCNNASEFRTGWNQLVSARDADRRIALIDADVQKLSIRDLYAAIDVYLSLHRSEGYGLNLAEAAQSGRAVIATAWGLSPDIASRRQVVTIGYDLIPVLDTQGIYGAMQCRWADPDVTQAAAALVRVREAVAG